MGSHTSSTATPHVVGPKVWLKEGHTLKGKDTLPVVLRIQSAKTDELEEMASISKKYPLESYSPEDLDRELKRLSGHDMKVRFNGFVVARNLELIRRKTSVLSSHFFYFATFSRFVTDRRRDKLS